LSTEKIESFFERSEKLTNIFGYWPDFHDAEVHELQLSRGEVNPDEDRYDFPVLTMKIHLWEMTNEAAPVGSLLLRHHTLATLHFTDIDNFRMEGFNHQNAITRLAIEHLERAEGPTPYFGVTMEPAFGMGTSFQCLRVVVVDALPCDGEGKPTA
jgi:hypothetical protein